MQIDPIKSPAQGRASKGGVQSSSFRFCLHHHEILLLGRFSQNLTVDALFLLGFCVTDKVGKGAFCFFGQALLD
ncbi:MULTISPECIES: hypothetical protein [Pseudomonas]|uniref:hypothetical protein n=1 Tax=Pseudomonas TaxID=286 RepID=UPI0018E61F6B|nr:MULTISPECIES: hypothetical protein [Pseudomonas]MBI6658367.1 hypothetical protein [Pseudomonas carnis]MBI6660324.1 hypothetical protein [Pseudomonas carnis]MBI6690297.1 hypothetical protein [Pseudomonas carnis]MBK3477305.1 hypothetical protein [Pseudomonas sp. MF6751]MBL4980085.1 hypothetical protein [Pseudomonas fluorescens]